jgi:transcriptional regulator with XRE-family HTH domain
MFTKTKITHSSEEIAEKLKTAREQANLKVKDVAKKISINQKYLEALENGELNKLPAGIYGRNFLREYANFLKLNNDELLTLYDSEVAYKNINSKSELFTQRVSNLQYILSLPKIVKNLIIILVVVVCISYLGFYIKNIVSPPMLNVINPADNITINEKSVIIEGVTEPEAQIIINNQEIIIDKNGYFSKTLDLKTGLNSILISAQKKYSKKNEIIKKILVK